MIGCSDIGATDTCCCGADSFIVIHGNTDRFLLMLAFGQVLTGSETPSGLGWAGPSVPRHPPSGAAPGPPRRLEQLDVAAWADVDGSQNFSEGSHPPMSHTPGRSPCPAEPSRTARDVPEQAEHKEPLWRRHTGGMFQPRLRHFLSPFTSSGGPRRLKVVLLASC